MQKYSSLTIFFLVFFIFHCDQIEKYQEKVRKKRYGKTEITSKKLPQWQLDVKQYEQEIDKKIKASDKAAKLYRKIGESFMVMESWKLCVKNLNRAIDLGYNIPDVFYSLGLCQGNDARMHNWNYNKTKQAEQTFLSLLNMDSSYSKAKFQLSLIYFYGYSKHNQYQVLASTITVKQKVFQTKAVQLMQQYQNEENQDYRSYFALAGMYRATGKIKMAQNQMLNLMSTIEKQQPNKYKLNKKYKRAKHNYNQLLNIKLRK